MTERTKKIKSLINGQVDMGTFGLVELELLAIETDSKKGDLLRAYFKWHKEKGYVSHKDSDIDEFIETTS